MCIVQCLWIEGAGVFIAAQSSARDSFLHCPGSQGLFLLVFYDRAGITPPSGRWVVHGRKKPDMILFIYGQNKAHLRISAQ